MSSNRRAVPQVWRPRRHVAVIGPLDVAAPVTSDQAITPTGASVTITPGTPALEQNLTPSGATVTITTGTATVTSDQNLTPVGATVTITTGTATVSFSAVPAPSRPRVAWGLGLVSTRRSVPKVWRPKRRVGLIGPLPVATDTSQAISPTGASVSITPGTATVATTGQTTANMRARVAWGPAFSDRRRFRLKLRNRPRVIRQAPAVLAITPTGATVTITAGVPALALNITPSGATVTITTGTVTVSAPTPQDITPVGASVTITAGTATVALSQAITPTGASVTITPGTASVFLAQSITPTGATVSITPGTPSLALSITPTGASVTITPGTPAVALSIAPVGATVTITPGTVLVTFGVPDPDPITLDIYDRGHQLTHQDDGHTLSMRDRHSGTDQGGRHTYADRERQLVSARENP